MINYNPKGVNPSYEDGLIEGYKQGKQDAINELCNILEKNAICVNDMVSMANVYHYGKQIKEDNNE